MTKKAQVSVDLIIILSIIFVIFLVVTITVDKRNDELISSRTKYYAKEVSDKVASEINTIILTGEGTTKTIELPASLKDNTDYNINIYPDSRLVEITWTYQDQTMRYSSPLISSDITGNLTDINNNLQLSNNNGVVNLEIEFICGNNVIEGTEVCDGSDLNEETCVSQGYVSGDLDCYSNCTYNTSSCVPDTFAPASVTGLDNQSLGENWIYWTWTNPGDVDFSEAIVYIDLVHKINTSANFYNATGLNSGTSYTITVHTKDTNGNVNNTDVDDTASTSGSPDSTPPASVTGLDNQSATTTSIYWNWTNPGDADFDEAIVYIDGSNVQNTSNNYYNATGLSSSTSYTITVHTKDTNSNVNNSDVNDTAITLTPYTLPDALMVFSSSDASTISYSEYNSTWKSISTTSYSPNSARRYVVVKEAPTRDEYIVVTSDNNHDVYARIFSGGSWHDEQLISNDAERNYRGFDVAYESDSGDAIVVANQGAANDDFVYYIWDGSSWTGPSTYATSVGDEPYWIRLAEDPDSSSDEIAMISLHNNLRVYAAIWDGSSFGNAQTLSTVVDIDTEEAIALEYEQQSGEAMFMWSDATGTINYRQWLGSSWDSASSFSVSAMANIANWMKLAANPNNDELMFGVLDGGRDLNTREWSGSAWDSAHTEIDGNTESHGARLFDLAYETDAGNSGNVLLVYGDRNVDQIDTREWRGSSWTALADYDPYAESTDKRVVQIISNNGTTEVLNVDDGSDLHHWYFDESSESWTSSGTALGEISTDVYNNVEWFMITFKR